jgi:hypothetical protein
MERPKWIGIQGIEDFGRHGAEGMEHGDTKLAADRKSVMWLRRH